MLRLQDFNYHLPPHLIAQQPARPRDHSRLLVLDKNSGAISHRHFFDLPQSLRPGDLLIVNDSKVFPARLFAHKAASGGRVEIFLLKKEKSSRREVWQCLLKGKMKANTLLLLDKGLEARTISDNEDGSWQVEFNRRGKAFMDLVFLLGQTPLPPYIKRNNSLATDKESYQTVYAAETKIGSVAAPTAGLHFTKKLMREIKKRGVNIKAVTLHVGLGTFLPVKTDNILEHKMHSEYFSITKSTAQAILKAKAEGRRVIAVGTTAGRTLETFGAHPKVLSGWTDIFIYPGYHFQIVDALVTNFHLPQSTLLMLVSALAGKENIDQAYQEAIAKEYRFFSYGDAMFIQ